MNRLGIAVLVMVLLAAIGVSAYFILKPEPVAAPTGGASFPRQNEIDVTVGPSKIPALNEPFFMNAIFTPVSADELDMAAYISLPSGAVYLDGDWKYRGPAQKGRGITISAKVAIVEEGKWSFTARAEAAGYRTVGGGQPETKPWYPIREGVKSFAVTVGSAGDAPPVGMYRPQPKAKYKTGEPIPMPVTGDIVGTELLNNTDQQHFLLIHDRAGIQNLRNLGLVPQELWGMWGPFQTRSLNDILHPDFNLAVIVLAVDKKRPTTGFRFFVESMEYGQNQDSVNIRVRSTAPPPGVPVANRAVSPYDITGFGKQLFEPGKPVQVRFFLNGSLQSQQTTTIRKIGEGITYVSDVYGEDTQRFTAVVKQGVSRLYNIPLANLELVPGRGLSIEPLLNSVHLGLMEFRDKSTGKVYRVVADAYGRVMAEKDLPRLNEAKARAKLARTFDGVDPELFDLLEKQDQGYVVQVEIWFRPAAPGADFADAAQPLIQTLSTLKAQPRIAANLPIISASLSKKNILELARRDDVGMIMKDRRN